jgi:outer membrane lipoprotein-sorting protein
MHIRNHFTLIVCALLSVSVLAASGQQPVQAPLPDIRDLMRQVQEHQKKLDEIRENYTYTSYQVVQDVDANGQVKKTESSEYEDFFVHGHVIERKVKANDQQLNAHDQEKETGRVTKLVEKAEKTPRDQPLEGPTISISRLLDIMDVRNERRELYRNDPTIVFDFVGRRNAKTHGMAEDASKKLEGTLWIDEADRQVVHLEVRFNDNFRLIGGILATVQKGSSFRFDQAKVNGEIWLPTGAEGTVQARLLLFKNLRQHFRERDYDYQRFKVETQVPKDAKLVPGKKP